MEDLLTEDNHLAEESIQSPQSPPQAMLWVDWHITVPGNQFLVPVDVSFIMNSFNMVEFKDSEHLGLTYFEEAHSQILGMAPRSQEELEDKAFQGVYQQAVDLYGLMHARYIQTKEGMQKTKLRFLANDFGTCPRVECNKDQNGAKTL